VYFSNKNKIYLFREAEVLKPAAKINLSHFEYSYPKKQAAEVLKPAAKINLSHFEYSYPKKQAAELLPTTPILLIP
jgi:CYTH domain-containing protein